MFAEVRTFRRRFSITLLTIIALAGCFPKNSEKPLPFDAVTRAIRADDFAPDHPDEGQVYRGTLFFRKPDTALTGPFRFTLQFREGIFRMTEFFVERLDEVSLRDFSAPVRVRSETPRSCLSAPADHPVRWIPGRETSRFVALSVPLVHCSEIPPLKNASLIFSADFTTLVGGEGSLFLIAQKASPILPNEKPQPYSLAHLRGDWPMYWFGIHGTTGRIRTNITQYSPLVSIQENGNWSGDGGRGSARLVHPGSGTVIYNYTDGSASPARALGVALLAPDRKTLLGVDFSSEPLYFAAQR